MPETLTDDTDAKMAVLVKSTSLMQNLRFSTAIMVRGRFIYQPPPPTVLVQKRLTATSATSSATTATSATTSAISACTSADTLLLPRGFSRSEYSNQQSSSGQCKISFDRVLVREKLFLKNGNSYIKSDEYSWDNILRANFCRKVTFGLWPFLWSNLAIFDFDGHFHQSNGGKDRQDSAHSCPHG